MVKHRRNSLRGQAPQPHGSHCTLAPEGRGVGGEVVLLRLEDLLHTGLADALLAAVPSAPAERLRSEDVPRPESRRAITMPCD